MVDWICSVPLSQLSLGLERVGVGRSADPRSVLYGTHFHVLHERTGSAIHLVGSDGPRRGAICHVEAAALGTDSSYRCVLPGDFQSLIRAEFNPAEVLRLGTRRGGLEFVVAGIAESRRLILPVLPGWGAQGLACFADAGFTTVEPGVYWVKGGVEPHKHSNRAPAQGSAAVQGDGIFVEDDSDEYDDELVPGESVDNTAPLPQPPLPPPSAPAAAGPAVRRAPELPRTPPRAPAAPAVQPAAPAAPSLRPQKGQAAKPPMNERVTNPSALGERTR